MTQTELLSIIRKEVERLKVEATLNKWEYSKKGYFSLSEGYSGGEAMAAKILSFLDTLEEKLEIPIKSVPEIYRAEIKVLSLVAEIDGTCLQGLVNKLKPFVID